MNAQDWVDRLAAMSGRIARAEEHCTELEARYAPSET